MPSVKTTISLRQDIYRAAKDKADRYFGGNFSAYVSYLISKNNQNAIRREIK